MVDESSDLVKKFPNVKNEDGGHNLAYRFNGAMVGVALSLHSGCLEIVSYSDIRVSSNPSSPPPPPANSPRASQHRVGRRPVLLSQWSCSSVRLERG